MSMHLTMNELETGLPDIRQAPQDNGTLELIVARPEADERTVAEQSKLTVENGLDGDNWRNRGSAHPEMQITLMNIRVVRLLDADRANWPLAGDQLFVDMDLSDENLAPGQRLSIGSAVLEITAQPHNGCSKFAKRFGVDALKFVNSPVGKQLHLRGIYAKVVEAGPIAVGDTISKI